MVMRSSERISLLPFFNVNCGPLTSQTQCIKENKILQTFTRPFCLLQSPQKFIQSFLGSRSFHTDQLQARCVHCPIRAQIRLVITNHVREFSCSFD